jgi:hypothetical protein
LLIAQNILGRNLEDEAIAQNYYIHKRIMENNSKKIEVLETSQVTGCLQGRQKGRKDTKSILT